MSRVTVMPPRRRPSYLLRTSPALAFVLPSQMVRCQKPEFLLCFPGMKQAASLDADGLNRGSPMLKLVTIGVTGTYSLGVVFVAAQHVISRFALDWGLVTTVVNGVVDSLAWPLWLFG